MKFWSEQEAKFLRPPYHVRFKLSMKIRLTACIVLSLALLEHCLFLANSAYGQYVTIKNCNCTDELTLSYFLTHQFAFIFEKIPLNLPYGLFVEIYNVGLTLSWNYMELFVMMVSIGLVARFNQINARISELDLKVRKDRDLDAAHFHFWNSCSSDNQRDDVDFHSFWLRSPVRARRASRSRASISHPFVKSQQSLLHLLSASQHLYVSSLTACLF